MDILLKDFDVKALYPTARADKESNHPKYEKG